jgi:galactokinase
MIQEQIKEHFIKLFGAAPTLFRSPGRINLIGEHTDYNDGFVLPAAIDKAIYIAMTKRLDTQVHLYSIDFKESFTIELADIKPQDGWSTYILGVVNQFQLAGYPLGGFNIVMGGDVPLGAGLSSSAAVECATAFALNEIFEVGLDRMTLVKMAQKAEHEYAGVKCGIMDQFASMFGKESHVIRLDCRSLEYEYFPLAMKDIKIVLLDTQVKHSLASSEYNTRREQCEEGVAAIQQNQPEVKNLRDATLEMLNEAVSSKSVVYDRCKYVIEEKERILEGCEDLRNNDLTSFGQKMYATHEGLSKLYQVSCKELDYLVDAVKHNSAVLGARMMGGGFGGCTINLVKTEAIDQLIATVASSYEAAMGKQLKAYIVQIENGTSKL